MSECNRFREVLIQSQRPRNVPGDADDFDGVRQSCPQMIATAIEENLRLVFEPAESARVDDAVAVALIVRAPLRRLFLEFAATCCVAELRVRRKELPLAGFEFNSRGGHETRQR